MKKIVLVTNIPSPYRVDLFHYMQKTLKEYQIHIIYTSKSEDNRQWTIDESKMINSVILSSKVVRIKGRMDDRFVHIPESIGKYLNKIKPHAVVAWEYNPAALQCLAWCKMYRVPLIHLTDGTLHSEKNIGKLQKLTRKIITKGASACIASSTKAKEKLLAYGVEEKKIFISLLTVDVGQYKKAVRNPIQGRILYVGSMIKRKGLDLLFSALEYVTVDWELHIVGNGSEEEIKNLKNIAKEKGIEDKIEWCGFKEKEALFKEYQEAAVFVLPTREDCFGLVLLEAMCANVPIVTSKYADGAYDVIVDGNNGYMIDPYDEKQFANAIDTVLSLENKQQECETVNKHIIPKFTFDSVTKGYLEAIEFTVNKK